MKISVLGCGRWGAFLAWYLNSLGHKVISWGRSDSSKLKQLIDTRSNGILSFDDKILLTSDLKLALSNSDTLVISISAQSLRSFTQELCNFDLSGKNIVLCMKGIEEKTGKRLSTVVRDIVPETVGVAVWVGPGHPQDFVAGIPNCMVIDSDNEELKRLLVDEFSSNLIRLYYGNDMIGNEIGAAAKNVIGIAAGMLDGLDRVSLKGALMSRGTREVSRLISAVGGQGISAYGLCHLGDYQATLFSPYSHNRRFGEAFVKGESYGELAEGAATTKALVRMGECSGVELPIVHAVDNVINKGADALEELSALFLRSVKSEF